MKKSILTTIVLTILGFSAFAFAPADTNRVGHNVKIIASSVLDIQMSVSTDVEFNFATSANYEAGITKTDAAELKVKSTKPWTVSVGSADANFTSTSGNNNTELARSALEFKKSTGSTFAGMSASATVATGTKGGHSATSNTFKVDYKLNPGYFAQDTYTLPVVYTVSHD
ncbi:MAG: hypothetical protein IPH28_21465 [Cytophagaceae bacterium]|nr:hypothetical protein [Cytophagaceae bacterium]MBK9509984.1 hypothetical protein [Cytophagaceae bacterium]MBK9933598.1 hypothetical protein [Cytophagaceae bacterium]MBL0302689.1 hypothetical protein [Cytophagaceae bacterium]MBL0325512.1 hypothetical protein [Cytophagaceae bacterium]